MARNAPGQGALPTIDRSKALAELGQAIETERLTLLLGDSGVGKSALLAQLNIDNAVVYRLTHEELAEEHGQWLREGIPLQELLGSRPGERAVLAVDGVEWLLSEADSRPLKDVLSALDLDNQESAWRVVLSCTTPQWSRVSSTLGVPKGTPAVELALLSHEQLMGVERPLPALGQLLRRRSLARLLGNVRVLRLLAEEARGGHTLPGADDLVGEASLVKWLWGRLADEDAAFAPVLELFAFDQATRRLRKLPEADIESSSRTTLSKLVERGTLSRERSTIRFVHDLWGDYGRQRWLLGQLDAGTEPDLSTLAGNVLWHRAIRLVGLHLLEVGPLDDGALTYENFLREASAWDDPTTLDLLLESVAFSVNPAPLLARVEPALLADSAKLLSRFLVRFRHSTSLPDPRVDEVALSPATRLSLAASWRFPDATLWEPVIRWLVRLPRDTRSGLAREIVDIAELWLLPPAWGLATPLAAELEAVVLDLVEDTRQFSYRFRGDLDERLMRSMLRGGRHQLERWSGLVRQLAGLNEPDAEQEEEEEFASHPAFWRRETIPKTAWDIGPRQDGDDAFRTAILTQPGATFLVQTDAALAVRAFLACIIEPPNHRVVGHSLTRAVDIGFREHMRLDPPFHDFPPAKALLGHAPVLGLALVQQLVEFATARLMDQWAAANGLPVGEGPAFYLTIDDEVRRFPGDTRIYSLARAGVDANDQVKACMMTLEQWLYEKLEGNADELAALIQELLGWQSAAVLGVLSDLALKRPSLLTGPLECLVSCERIHLNSTRRAMLDETLRVGMMDWTFPYPRHGLERAKEVQAWHMQAHRYLHFTNLVAQLLANKGREWPVVRSAIVRWRSIIQDLDEDSTIRMELERLVATLDADTWIKVVDDDGREGWQPVLPAHVEEKRADRARKSENALLWLQLPDVCWKILTGELQLKVGSLERLRDCSEAGYPEAEQERLGRCAVASVLLSMADDAWWAGQEELRQRCFGWILDGIHSDLTAEQLGDWQPKPDAWMMGLLPVRAHSAVVFQALAVPRMWRRSKEDSVLRTAMALLATSHNQEGVELLFKVAFLELGVADNGFRRLLHLAVQYSRLWMEAIEDQRTISWARHNQPSPSEELEPASSPDETAGLKRALLWLRTKFLALFSRTTNSSEGQADDADTPSAHNGGEVSQMPEISIYAQNLVASFVDGSLPPIPDDWVPVRKATLVRPVRAGVQGAYLVSAFGWLWNAAELPSGPERSWARVQLIALQREIWERVEPKLRAPRKGWQHKDEHPYDSDREVSRMGARWFHTEEDGDARSKLASLWIDASDGTSDWFDAFANGVFDGFMHAGANTADEAQLLADFLRLALKRDGDTLASAPVRDLRDPQTLLGCPSVVDVHDRWSEDRAPLADALVPFLGPWADHFLGHYSATRSFLRLLRTPAMKAHRPSLLLLLAERGTDKLKDRDCDSELTLLLDQAWRENSRELRRGAPREAFDQLLSFALARQVPEALHLADIVAGG